VRVSPLAAIAVGGGDWTMDFFAITSDRLVGFLTPIRGQSVGC
jgi:hypothetical protein